ncbi:hypothetical protein F2Q68_00029387 [Brassica cretica]|uniref:Uncharacterized protein n=1 Tax=Brassica cretica TaxID=69181 RepID=A0A8S9G702_BRACR|nr:hypothetical protein F2Q68_00029387 [Brassica cretica]
MKKDETFFIPGEPSCLRIERGRDEDGVTRPLLVNFIQSSVILSDDEDFLLMLLSHCAYDHSLATNLTA